jgi:high-affinity Fe2+/Pb2+ permease
LVLFEEIVVRENMSVFVMLAIFFVSLISIGLFNYFWHYEEEFPEMKEWERFKKSFD